jgi:ribosomal protein S18 acetylase RimI-like enzyme
MKIEPMQAEDYDSVMALWKGTQGVGLSDADSRESIAFFLQRNPGLSFVLRDGSKIVGTIMAGHDGRRGYLYHLSVLEEYRREGWGKRLANVCIAGLHREGIQKCHLFVFKKNGDAIEFWRASGWTEREEIRVFSKPS